MFDVRSVDGEAVQWFEELLASLSIDVSQEHPLAPFRLPHHRHYANPKLVLEVFWVWVVGTENLIETAREAHIAIDTLITEQVSAGMSVRALAKLYGCRQEKIAQIAREQGAFPKRGRPAGADIASNDIEAVYLAEGKRSYRRTGRLLGVHGNTVKARLANPRQMPSDAEVRQREDPSSHGEC